MTSQEAIDILRGLRESLPVTDKQPIAALELAEDALNRTRVPDWRKLTDTHLAQMTAIERADALELWLRRNTAQAGLSAGSIEFLLDRLDVVRGDTGGL